LSGHLPQRPDVPFFGGSPSNGPGSHGVPYRPHGLRRLKNRRVRGSQENCKSDSFKKYTNTLKEIFEIDLNVLEDSL